MQAWRLDWASERRSSDKIDLTSFIFKAVTTSSIDEDWLLTLLTMSRKCFGPFLALIRTGDRKNHHSQCGTKHGLASTLCKFISNQRSPDLSLGSSIWNSVRIISFLPTGFSAPLQKSVHVLTIYWGSCRPELQAVNKTVVVRKHSGEQPKPRYAK